MLCSQIRTGMQGLSLIQYCYTKVIAIYSKLIFDLLALIPSLQ